MEWSGGCLCRAIKYRARDEPLDVASCHCVNCRKMSGAAFTTFVVFSPDQFEWRKGDIAVAIRNGIKVPRYLTLCASRDLKSDVECVNINIERRRTT